MLVIDKNIQSVFEISFYVTGAFFELFNKFFRVLNLHKLFTIQETNRLLTIFKRMKITFFPLWFRLFNRG